MKNNHISGKIDRLKTLISQLGPMTIAFSGGVDSTFLLWISYQVLGGQVQAIIAKSPLFSRYEEELALKFLRTSNIPFHVVEPGVMDEESFIINHKDRCYVCKKLLFKDILAVAERTGKPLVAHGVNVDDLSDYRPGLKAASELGIQSPLAEAGFTKADIREASRNMGLSSADMPSMACLASRLPYGETVTRDKLRKIEEAENTLRRLGFQGIRARYHGDVVRLEISDDDFPHIIQKEVRKDVVKALNDLGFLYVSLDLAGYSQGSLNRAIGK